MERKLVTDSIHPGENGCNFYQVPASDLLVSGINKALEMKSSFFPFKYEEMKKTQPQTKPNNNKNPQSKQKSLYTHPLFSLTDWRPKFLLGLKVWLYLWWDFQILAMLVLSLRLKYGIEKRSIFYESWMRTRLSYDTKETRVRCSDLVRNITALQKYVMLRHELTLVARQN